MIGSLFNWLFRGAGAASSEPLRAEEYPTPEEVAHYNAQSTVTEQIIHDGIGNIVTDPETGKLVLVDPGEYKKAV
jgi:hypothetical protein